MQQQLTEIGFDVGVIDGLSGSKTESAIRRYQAAQRLPEDGYASPALLQHVQQAYEAAMQAGKLVSTVARPTFSDPTP